MTGPRGAPGRTEVALGLAWCMAGDGPVALIDADRHAPALAVRLGIPPRPDVADAVDHIFSNGVESTPDTHRLGRLRVLPGAHRPGEPALRSETVFDVVEALRGEAAVVVDLGPFPEGGETLKASTEAWMVIDASPIGVVRAATALAEWAGPPPRIALNRVRARSGDDTLRAVRRWTGLEPAAVIGFSTAIANAASGGQSPARTLLAPLSRACR